MKMLVYCVTDRCPPAIASRGIFGEEINVIQHSGLECLVSSLTGDATAVTGKEQALEFHRVLQEVFHSRAVIPFRFPTIVEDESELRQFIDGRRDEYLEALDRLRDMVQMEVRIAGESGSNSAVLCTRSGTEYLVGKQRREFKLKAAADLVRSAARDSVKEWRERDSALGKRLFCLVERSGVNAFKASFESLKIEPGVAVRISGPWPASEFISKDHE